MSPNGILFSTPFLEFVAGFQFIVAIGLAVFLGWFIYRTVQARQYVTPTDKRGQRRSLMWLFWTSPSLKLAWALGIFASGDAINRGLVWYTRHAENTLGFIIWNKEFTAIALVAAIINSWGGLCALRMAAPASSGERPWLIVLACALLFSIGATYGRSLY